MPHVQHVHPAPKRFALGRKQFTTTENQERELTEDEFVRHTKEICQEMKKKNLNTEHINMLLTATMVNRRKWISTIPAGLISPILMKFPCFWKSSFVSIFFFLMMQFYVAYVFETHTALCVFNVYITVFSHI